MSRKETEEKKGVIGWWKWIAHVRLFRRSPTAPTNSQSTFRRRHGWTPDCNENWRWFAHRRSGHGPPYSAASRGLVVRKVNVAVVLAVQIVIRLLPPLSVRLDRPTSIGPRFLHRLPVRTNFSCLPRYFLFERVGQGNSNSSNMKH